MRCWVYKFVVFGIFLNALFVSLSILPVYLIKQLSSPYVRGFDPSDSTIALTVKPNTVSSGLATWGSTLIAAGFIVLVEFVVAFCRYRTIYGGCNKVINETSAEKMISQQPSSEKPSPKQIWLDTLFICWLLLVLLMTGSGINGTVTNIAKILVARPRPSFMHFCRPDYYSLNNPACTPCGSYSRPGPGWPLCRSCPFIDGEDALNKVCNDPLIPQKAKDMWLSFPSGHASYAMFSAVFIAVYLHSRMRESVIISHYLVAFHPLAIFASLFFGIFTAFSRVADHRHHLTDVIAGSILGSTIGFVVAVTVALPLLQRISKQKLYYCDSGNCGKIRHKSTTIANNNNEDPESPCEQSLLKGRINEEC